MSENLATEAAQITLRAQAELRKVAIQEQKQRKTDELALLEEYVDKQIAEIPNLVRCAAAKSESTIHLPCVSTFCWKESQARLKLLRWLTLQGLKLHEEAFDSSLANTSIAGGVDTYNLFISW